MKFHHNSRRILLIAATALSLLAAAACTPAPPTGSLPGSISVVTATAGVRSATLTFDEPAANTSPITSYEVSISSGPEQKLGKDRVVSGLTEGSFYTFRVRACSASGCALWSPKSNAITPRPPISVPDGVGVLTASPGNKQATLSFTAPDDNGAPILTYNVLVNDGAPFVLAADRVVISLENNTSYTFRVQACNAAGCGDWSAASTAVKPRTVPSAPGVGVTVSGRTLRWTWNTPSGNGATVTSFEVRLDGNLVQTGTDTSFSRSFGYSETHTLTVRAINAAGAGPAGSASARTVNAPPPTPKITLTRGGPGLITGSSWYNIVFTNFPAGSTVATTCHDSVDPGGFATGNISINGSGSGTSSRICFSADGPGHWVTGGGRTSNIVNW